MQSFKKGELVYVSGEVEYGDREYRVACNGIVHSVGNTESLVTVDSVDGDRNVTVYVLNKCISKVDKQEESHK